MRNKKGIVKEVSKVKGKEAPKPGSKEFLDLSKYASSIRDMYLEDLAQDTFNALVLGSIGCGKTTFTGTGRKPLYVHSFDPGGTKSLKNFSHNGTVTDLIASGEAIVDTRYESDDSGSPKSFKLWQREFEMMRRRNYFQHIGTYVLDSFTTWMLSLKYMIAKNKGREEGVLARNDWQILGNIVRDTINVITALPCDVVLTGHLTAEKDDVTGRIVTKLQAIPSLQNDLPILFDEIYCMESEETRSGVNVTLITRNTGKYDASTRIGSGVFETREEPDIKKLLKKADYKTEDKPLFNQQQ